jgi:SAM-dependent methyltransferase
VPAGEPGDPRWYPLPRCATCGSAVTGGDPPGPEHYETGVYSRRPPRAAVLLEPALRVAAGQPARLLRRAGLPPGARVLDVGAGRGRQLAALRRAGFDARGIDPSGRGAGVARATLERHEDSELDAVLLWHVLEHLEDPASSLTRVRSWLRPGGLVLVGVPNLGSAQAGVAGPGWLHLDVPRHRTHFTVEGLRRALERAGFDPGRPRHVVLEHNVPGMWMALLTRAGMRPGLPFHLLKRTVRPRARDVALLAAGALLLPVAAVLELAAAGARSGGTIAVVAIRR